MKIAKSIINIRRNLTCANPVPLSIAVNITGRCNLSCKFCEKSRQASTDEIDIKQLKGLIDFSLEHDCSLFLSGGEPFLHKQIWDILSYCKTVGKKISVVTNATMLHGLSSERYELLNDTIAMMSVSLDSADADEHDRLRGVKNTFERALNFLTNPLRKNKVGINCLLTPEFKNIKPMLELAKEVKCSLNFQPLIFESNYPDLAKLDWKEDIQKEMALSAEKMNELRSLEAYARKLKVGTNLALIMKYIDKYFKYADTDTYFENYVLDKFTCFVPFQQLTVDEKGYIVPCVFLKGEQSIYDGDLYGNWQKMALKYRKMLKEGRNFKVCQSCSCHFADNFRSSVIAYPLINRKQLWWLSTYYLKRVFRGEGRRV